MLEIRQLKARMLDIAALDVPRGQCVALVGASGSGKTLFLRAIADLDPNAGSVRLNGTDRHDMPAHEWRAAVALVPTESGWWADTVGDHFFARDGVAELLDALGVATDALGWSVARLSTGERQRLALARAMALRPRALLLDEPTASLDDGATERVEALLRRQLEAGTAILLVTHDTAQAARMGVRTEILENGRLASRSKKP